MQHITLSSFSNMLYKGSKRIIENKKEIDGINVFPVADSDTGSNLASTFLGIKQLLERESFKSMKDFTDSVLEIAFVNSRGNSGIMMVSFLKGFLSTLKNNDKIFLADLAKAAEKGEEASRDSVEKPVGGTMLDVMEAFSDTLALKTNSKDKIADIFYKTTEKVKAALIDTQKKLKILRKTHVVDAGALGFTHFIFGLYEGLSNNSVELSGINIKPIQGIQGIGGRKKSAHEVILTIQNAQFSVVEIKQMFDSLGESLDIVEVEKKVKIHIHTDNPEVVKETASLTGEILDIRVLKL